MNYLKKNRQLHAVEEKKQEEEQLIMGQENVKPNRHIIKNNEIFWFNKKENTNESALVNDKWHVFRRYQHEREECTRLLCSLTLRLVVLKVLCGVMVEENVVQGSNLPTVKFEKSMSFSLQNWMDTKMNKCRHMYVRIYFKKNI